MSISRGSEQAGSEVIGRGARRSGAAPTRVLTAFLRVYQLAHQGRLPSCRYMPTCSAYALEAIEGHGVLRGSWLAGRRLLRCHPWGGSGLDPVPSPRNARPSRKAQTC